ncbi:MAG: hypothetical protein ACR2PJ_00690 [Pseudomonadales bacterium]
MTIAKTLGRALGIAALVLILAGSISGCTQCPEIDEYYSWTEETCVQMTWW